ncbi:BSD domain-containing protein C22A12.14c-like [Zingiber officinale]|uniref:BSD domain-containing protein n=1 Tax=Zingiber officinale TaxID=94328 RepID=A0A8J5H594_ZINOF|nr:BSD domain-containing protein C22A12.14c-like [Zingiber officinale]KAG6512644.1 hypothetical protein ZIOFF_030769 [Zingiber officinale]
MDFFKSVFASDPATIPQHESPTESPSRLPEANETGGNSGWRGLIKTFATKSESVIQTYRRDLEEFGSGLKKETEALREVASQAVRHLPDSLEARASAAQESLESVGQAIDEFGGSVWRGTEELISQGKASILAMEGEGSGSDRYSSDHGQQSGTPASMRYSRFEVQVVAIQSDMNTFSEEPEDVQGFNNWKLGFDLDTKEDEIEKLCFENGALEGFLEKLVPRSMDYETFWLRYYYRVHKLKQAEDARAKLVKRVISGDEEEDLSWEVGDDDQTDEESKNDDDKKGRDFRQANEKTVEVKKDEIVKMEQKDQMNNEPIPSVKNVEVSQVQDLDASNKNDNGATSDSANADESQKNKEIRKEDTKSELVRVEKHAEVSQVDKLEASTENVDETSNLEKQSKSEFAGDGISLRSDDKTDQRGKVDTGESVEDSSHYFGSSQPSAQVEDLEWDEIENLGEHDETKSAETSVSPLNRDLRKRPIVVEEDEDLSWDIEDDDEPTKP